MAMDFEVFKVLVPKTRPVCGQDLCWGAITRARWADVEAP